MNTVERVARAMWERESIRATGRKRLIAWEDEGDDTHSTWMDRARAAIEALREPTMEMVEVGYTEINNNIESWNYDSDSGYAVEDIAPTATWRAMIDAALGEPK